VITYNDRQHVAQAIESALAQSYPHREVIVVDDGSTDGTREYVDARFGDSIRYIYKPNGGMGSARAAGIRAARGRYIQHLDSDDLLLPDKIASQVAYLEAHPETAFVYGRSICFYDDDLSVQWEHHANVRAQSGNLFEAIVAGGNFVIIAQPLFRASWIERVGGWDAQARVADDYDIMVRLAYAGAVAHFLDEPVYLYRMRRVPFDSDLANPYQWRSIEVLARGEIYILGKLAACMVRDGRPGLATIRKRIGAAEFSLGWGLFRSGKRWESCAYILKGLRSNRERWPYKVMVLVGAALLPGQRLLRLKRWLGRRKPLSADGDR
jgi:glycosyltransferase involved in cell wall biosynthesis